MTMTYDRAAAMREAAIAIDTHGLPTYRLSGGTVREASLSEVKAGYRPAHDAAAAALRAKDEPLFRLLLAAGGAALTADGDLEARVARLKAARAA